MARSAAASRSFALLLGALLLHVTREAEARPLAPVHLTLEIVANPVEGAAGPPCRVAGDAEAHRKAEWWVEFGRAEFHPDQSWHGTGGAIRCGAGPAEAPQLARVNSPISPYLAVGVTTVARPLQERGDFSLEISLSLGKLSGFDAQGTPSYERASANRSVFFLGEGETVVPLLVASESEGKELGVREVLLRLHATSASQAVASAYGAISVISPWIGAEILLDGGVVGNVQADRPTMLPNVRAGEREIGVREASGRRIRRWVRVWEGRTALVALAEPAPSGSGDDALIPLGKNTQGHAEYRRRRDGATVVRVPGGEFLMGNRETERRPLEHRVSVGEFLLDKTEVTWGRYRTFAAATGKSLPPDPPWWGIHDDHPAVFVTWEEGRAYCEWAGARLPTEAEWERACRGDDERMYPWGNEEPTPERAVYRRSWGIAATDPAGAHPTGASPYGLLDLGGSLWEYVADWYDESYYQVSPPRDPRGPASGRAHGVRGGSWDSRPSVLSCSCRSWGHIGYREGDFGFRCAMDAAE
jgi:formylglycine-generating enzyme required for sulfatase activity